VKLTFVLFINPLACIVTHYSVNPGLYDSGIKEKAVSENYSQPFFGQN
jgi:hypothetical protein